MADRGRREEALFFIYDHNALKKEEDDLKDAIIFFTPDSYTIDEQCALCGQLMGMSEYLLATISNSAPYVFRFEHEKYVMKRTGSYSFVLRGGSFTPDSLLYCQLAALCQTFITFHGSIDSLKLRCKDSPGGFLTELSLIWGTILQVSGIHKGASLSKTFQSLQYVQLPKSGAHLFLQASHLLQSSQRRPYVLAGTILYRNGVLSTQLPPKLTKHLTYLQNQVPHIVRKTECDLPVGCRIITVFLTDEELSEIAPLEALARRHCKLTDFSVGRQKEDHSTLTSKSPKHPRSPVKRRLTCPNLSLHNNIHKPNSISQKALSSFLSSVTEPKKLFSTKQGSVAVEKSSWTGSSKLSLSSVPIVECRSGESPVESDAEMLYDKANEAYFSNNHSANSHGIKKLISGQNILPSEIKTYQQIEVQIHNDNEESESEPETEDTKSDTHNKQTSTSRVSNNTFEKTVETQTSDDTMETDRNVDVNPDGLTVNPREICDKHDDKATKGFEEKENSLDLDNGGKEKKCNEEEANITENRIQHKELSPLVMHQTQSENESSIDSNSIDTNESVSTKDLKKESKLSQDTCSRNVKVIDNTGSALERKIAGVETENVEEGVSISDLENNSAEEEELDSFDTGDMTLARTKGLYAKPKEKVVKGIKSKIESSNNSSLSNESCEKENNTGILMSNSSEEGAKTRYYDKIADEETTVLDRDKNHTVHKHVAAVHVEPGGATIAVNNSNDKNNDQIRVSSTVNEANSNSSLLKSSNNDIVTTSETDSPLIRSEEKLTSGKIEGRTGHHGYLENDIIRKKVDKGKENIDPNMHIAKRLSSDSQKYESEIETEDESVSIATIEPCINCLELTAQSSSHKPGTSVIRCTECVALFNKQRVFGVIQDDQEIIDFKDSRDRYDSGNETEGQGQLLTARRGSEQEGKFLSSLSSDVSTDSTISRYWTYEMEGLNDVTLYVQCHSDISLLLLMENPEHYQEDLFHALWKGSLAQLADLDFYIKECMENSEDGTTHDRDTYRYLKYDSYASDLKGTIEDPHHDRRSINLHQTVSCIHTEFQENTCLSDVMLRSHFNSCYGHANDVEETYFQPELQQRVISGFPTPKDPVYNLDALAKQKLAKDKHISLL